MRRIALLIAIVMAALTTNAAISNNEAMLERLASIAYHTMRLTDSDLEWLEKSQVIDNGAAWADSVRTYNGEVSFSFLNDFLKDVLHAFEKKKMQHTDGYRLMLMAKNVGHDMFYEYEEKDEALEMLRDNIARYITAPDDRSGWELMAELGSTEYYTLRGEWKNFVLTSRIERFLNSNPDISDHLRFLLNGNLITAVYGSQYAMEPKVLRSRIAEQKKLAGRIWPDFCDIILNDIEFEFLEATIIADPDGALLEVMQLSRMIDEGGLIGVESFQANRVLSDYFFYKNENEQGQRHLDKMRSVTQKMSGEYGRVNAATNAVCFQKLMLDNGNQAGQDRDIYDELKEQFGDSKYARRCLAAALSDFVHYRTGQTSELPTLQAARDYYELIKDDPYEPYRFGAVLSAGMKIAFGGQVNEGLGVIEDLEPAKPFETFLRSIVAMEWEANFNTRPERLYEAALEAFETNRSTGINSAEDDNIIINYLAQSAADMRDAERLAYVKPLVTELCAKLGYSPWEIYAQWDIAISEALMQENVNKRINTLKSLLAHAEKMNVTDKAVTLAYQLSLAHMLNNNTKEAEAAIEKALDYSSLNGLDIWLYNEYLTFLHDIKSDHAKWRKMVSAVVADAEQFHLDIQFPFLQLVVNQLSMAINDNNMEDVWVMMGLFYEKGNKIALICQDDPFAQQMVMNTVLPMFSQLSIFLDTLYENALESEKEIVNEMFGNLKDNIGAFVHENLEIIENGQYNNVYQTFNNRMALCWIKLALEGTEKATEYLDKTKEWAQEVGLGDSKTGAFTELELTLAWRNNDYGRIEKILDTPEFWSKVQNRSLSIKGLTVNLSALITSKFAREDYVGAQKIAEKRQELVREYIDAQFMDLSESQRDALFTNGTASTMQLNTALRYNPTPKAAVKAFDATLYYRNLLLSSSQSLRRAVYDSGDSTQIADYERMLQYRALAAKGSTSTSMTQDESLEVARNARIARELEDTVYTRAAEAGMLETRRTYKFSDVAKALKDDEVAIEFIADTDNYGALIARKGYKAPVYVPLLDAAELRELLQHTQNSSLKTGMQKLYAWRSDGKKTYRGVWEPIEPYLTGARVIYYTPDNDLNQISFAAIEDSTRTALCEKYDLRLVSSTGNLAARTEARRKKNAERTNLSCVAIGGVPYDLDAARDPARKDAWHALPNAAIEVARFDSICTTAGFSPVLYTGEQTREENFRSLSGSSPDILLLATHGYYHSPEQASKKSYYLGKGLTKEEAPNYAIPAMNRGGLILADANPVWVNERTMPDEIDGVLTASEIATLNLSNTKLLILSACETALGSNSILCGVNGLQRGFKLAGVNSIIMSLWEVNDVAGEKFMKEFYAQFFATGDRYEAFQKARLKLKEQYPRDPSLWAPFIMLD